MTLLDRSAVPFQAVLTKIDKLGPNALQPVIDQVEAELQKHPAAFPQIVVTSSDKGQGITTIIAGLD